MSAPRRHECTEICFAVGFQSLGSFSTRFSELVGASPSAYAARDHDALRVVPGCQTMVLTRPRQRDRKSSFQEARAVVAA